MVTKVFYGWRIVFASMLGIVFGVSTMLPQTIGVVMGPLTHEFGWSRSQVTLAQVVAVHTLVLFTPLAGYLGDRFSIRWLASVSAALMGLSLASLMFFHGSALLFWCIYGLSAALGSCTTPVTFASIISRWFDRRRGLALGMTFAGVGVGVALLPALMTITIAHSGWRGAYGVLGACAALIAAPVMAIFFRQDPRDMGLAIDGATGSQTSDRQPPAISLPLGMVFRSSIFWRLVVVFVAFGGAFGGVVVHIIPLMIDQGRNAATAASFLSVLGLSSIVGRVVIGQLLDRANPAYLAAATLIPAGVAVACLSLNLPLPMAMLVVAVIGLANGAEVDILAYMVGRLFGLGNFGRIYGILFSVFTLGGAWGGLMLARLYDVTGQYQFGLWALGAGIIAGCVILLTVAKAARQTVAA